MQRDRLRVDARGVRRFTTHWEIAVKGSGSGMYPLGTAEGSNPTTALESWIEEGGHIWPGTYGVRAPGQPAWQSFCVDASGEVHDRRLDLTT
jgi:hypothetical protein